MNKGKKVIGIYGVPRSGTTWLGEIINSSENVVYKFLPQFAYRFRGRISESTSFEELSACFEELFVCEDDFLDQKQQRDSGKLPIFRKNKNTFGQAVLVYKENRFLYTMKHILETYPSFLLIGIIRNPIDTLNSWLNAPKEFLDGWDIDSEWRLAELKNGGLEENFFGYEKWKEAVKLFDELKREYEGRVYIIQYENLVKNSLTEVENLFSFCGISLGEQTRNFLQESQSRTVNDTYAVFRDKGKRSYPKTLSSDIVSIIKEDVQTDTVLSNYYSL